MTRLQWLYLLAVAVALIALGGTPAGCRGFGALEARVTAPEVA